MMNAVKEFVWWRVRWDRPDEPISNVCSYCGVEIDEDSTPLRMWIERTGHAAVFCMTCEEHVISLLLEHIQ